ncbi:unnamed protein product [Prorocentrum cordatum]|uniref:Uncharacterized protein n=1 Tax=Prorocentrum cordatum TaxID=2364126 RepID=A0ABN9YIF3_9DINO|nr:unnamed protein product [Polarella glacialis]
MSLTRMCAPFLAGAEAAGPLPELPAGALYAMDLEKALSGPRWAPGVWATPHAETVSFVSGPAAGRHLAEREPQLPPGMRCTCGAAVVSAPLRAPQAPLAAWQTGCALAPPPRPALLECRSGPGASGEGSDVDDALLDGEADAATPRPPDAVHVGSIAAAAAAYLAAFPQALLSGGSGGRARCEVAAGAWWRARAVVARAWLTAGAATVQEGGTAGSAAPPPPLLDQIVPPGGQVARAECPLPGCAAGAEAPPPLRRVRFADAPRVFEIGSCLGMRGVLRRPSAPEFLGPAWARHAKAVDLMHMIEGDSFGFRIPPTRRPERHRARFADESRLVEALPPGMSVERVREIDRLLRLRAGQQLVCIPLVWRSFGNPRLTVSICACVSWRTG